MAAARRFSVAPVLAQLIPRDLSRAGVPAAARIAHVAGAAASAHFSRPWGADAHGVKTETDVGQMAAAGVTWFTLDPSAFIENRADALRPDQVHEELAILGKEGVLPAGWIQEQSGRRHEIDGPGGTAPTPDQLARAAVKFARALHHAQRLARHVSAHSRHVPFDLELALVECTAPATTAEHLFVALEARRRGLPLTALALRWDAGLEPAAEFAGDAGAFEERMRRHAALAARLGPYKLSVHHGGAKFSLLPALGRAVGEPLHVKTVATTFLAGLRVVCRAAPELFREVAAFARERFESERVPHLISTTRTDVDRLFRGAAWTQLEAGFLDSNAGRQLLDTTAGSILHAGMTSRGRPFREAILEVLHDHRDDHIAQLDALFTRHLELLNQG